MILASAKHLDLPVFDGMTIVRECPRVYLSSFTD